MKRISKFFVIALTTLISVQTMPFVDTVVCNTNSTEYWGVIVVSLAETLHPYVYDALIQANNWDEDHIRLLWKQDASRENIFDALSWVQSRSDENDVVLFSVDCHGVYIGGDYGIWPSDGDSNGFVTIDELESAFDKITAEGICLIFDCCFSGTFVEPSQFCSKNTVSGARFKEKVISGLNADNRVVIMGTMPNGLGVHWIDVDPLTGEQTVDISPSSVVANGLIEGNDMNDDGITSAEEAYLYLKENFRRYALKGFLNIPLQMFCYLAYGFFTLPFPTISDNYDGEMPLVE